MIQFGSFGNKCANTNLLKTLLTASENIHFLIFVQELLHLYTIYATLYKLSVCFLYIYFIFLRLKTLKEFKNCHTRSHFDFEDPFSILLT